MTQEEIAEWLRGGRVIKSELAFHCMWGMRDDTLTVEHGNCVYLIARIFDPSKPEGERVKFEQPILIEHGVQIELKL